MDERDPSIKRKENSEEVLSNKINNKKSEEVSNKSLWNKILNFEYRPISTLNSTLACCLIFGIIFTVLGIILLYLSSTIKEVVLRYDNLLNCEMIFSDNSTSSNKECEVEFTVYEEMEPPVNIYYELENFYQNHRRFIQSQSISQLKGNILTAKDIELDCSPIITVKDLGINKTFGNFTLDDDAPANPCGLYPRSFFNDTYKLKDNKKLDIFINQTNIARQSDKDTRFKSPLNSERIQWINTTDEHFMVWMRPAGTSNFRKLWGRVNKTLTTGNYTLTITNNYKVSDFNGKKKFVLSTSNLLGGKNTFIGTAYIALGVICFMSSAIFCVAYQNKVSHDKKNL